MTVRFHLIKNTFLQRRILMNFLIPFVIPASPESFLSFRMGHLLTKEHENITLPLPLPSREGNPEKAPRPLRERVRARGIFGTMTKIGTYDDFDGRVAE
jgi:hypothetical protein